MKTSVAEGLDTLGLDQFVTIVLRSGARFTGGVAESDLEGGEFALMLVNEDRGYLYVMRDEIVAFIEHRDAKLCRLYLNANDDGSVLPGTR